MELIFTVLEGRLSPGGAVRFPFALHNESSTTLRCTYEIEADEDRFEPAWCRLQGPGTLDGGEVRNGELEIQVPDEPDVVGIYHLRVTARAEGAYDLAMAGCVLVVESAPCARFSAAPKLRLNTDGTVTATIAMLNCGEFDLDVTVDLDYRDLWKFRSDGSEVTLRAQFGPVEVKRTFSPPAGEEPSEGDEITVEIKWQQQVLASTSQPLTRQGVIEGRRARWLWVAAGALMVTALGGLAVFAVDDNGPSPTTTTTVTTAPTGVTTGPIREVVFSVSPQSLDFDRLRSRQATLVVTNTGPDAISIQPPEVVGEDDDQFTAVDSNCIGRPLAARRSCEMQVRFAPKVAGTHTAQAVVSAAGGTRALPVALRGTQRPVYTLAPTSIWFPGAGRTETVVVRNTGALPMVVLASEIVGQDQASFRARSGDCTGGPVNPGDDCSIAVTFVSTDSRVHRAMLVIPVEGDPQPAQVTLSSISIE